MDMTRQKELLGSKCQWAKATDISSHKFASTE
jgi:hypothetical protein